MTTTPEDTLATRPKAHWGRLLLVVVGLGLLLGLIAKVGWIDLVHALRSADLRYVFASSSLYVVGQLLRGSKWIYWLRQSGLEPDVLGVLGSYSTKAFIANLTPARAGEATGPFLLNTRCRVPLSTGSAVVLLDQLIDFAVLSALFAMSAILLVGRGKDSVELSVIVTGTGVLMALGAGTAFFLWRASGWLFPDSEAKKGARWAQRFHAAVRRFRAAVETLATPSRLGIGTTICLLCWVVDMVAWYFMIRAIVPLSFLDSTICQLIGAGAGLVSLIPGGMGVTVLAQSALGDAFGYDFNTFASATIVNVGVTQVARALLAAAATLLKYPSPEPA